VPSRAHLVALLVPEVCRTSPCSLDSEAVPAKNTGAPQRVWLLGPPTDSASLPRLGISTVTTHWFPSGPAVKPIALRMVWQTAQAVKVPIIGMGGIASATDAIEFLLAGASAVEVGTYNFVDPSVTTQIVDGIEDYMRRHGFTDIQDLIGALQIPKKS